MEMITWARGGTLGRGDGSLGCDISALQQERTQTPAPSHPACFPTEFGKEKSIPLSNLSVDEVGKALESVVKSHA